MRLRVEVEGFDSAAETLSDLRGGLCEAAAAGLAAGLEAMAETARENAPVKSGRLRESIGSEAQADGAGASGALYAGTPYAALVELGGASAPAQPFLYPAAETGLEALKEAVRTLVLEGER